MPDFLSFLDSDSLALALSVVWSLHVLVVAVWVLMQRRAPAATLGWLLGMALLPVVGLAVFYILGPQRLQRQRQRRLRSRRDANLRASIQRLARQMPQASPRLHHLARLVTATTRFPVCSASEVHLLVGGAATFDDMITSIATARHHIHLEFYIFEPDHTGQRLLAALAERARAGVQVRLLVDALGSKRLGRRHCRELLNAGGELALFHPARLGRRIRPVINFRTHRKILVIDGSLGYTGGVNITDEEDSRLTADAYHDVHLRLRGGAVNWLQTVFLEDWRYAQREQGRHAGAPLRDYAPYLPQQAAGDEAVQIMASGPDSPMQAIHRVFIAAIQAAHQRLWLTTPYFVPSEAAMLALTSAALRGVDVRVLVPQQSDSRLVTAAAQSYFDELIRCGVKVYEYQASMLHSKTLVADEMVGIIGTANFDNRSFLLNYEVCAVVYGPRFARTLAAQFRADLRHARRVPHGRRCGFTRRLVQSVARLCSPLL